MSLRVRPIDLFLAVATVSPLVAASALIFGSYSQPDPTLEQVIELAQAKRFPEAQERSEAFLQRHPHDPNALLVTAELALNRPSPDPKSALDRLERIQADSPSLAAWVGVDRGRAFQLLFRWGRAEACWKEALRTDVNVLESGRRLFDLYDLQGRKAEARSLGLNQLDHEPDPRDRLRTLARLARLDVDPPDPWDVVNTFKPAADRDLDDLASALAYGLALVHVSRSDEGLTTLRVAVKHHPQDPSAWSTLLDALDVAGQYPEMVEKVASLPASLKDDPRFAKHRGRVAQEQARWADAAQAYRQAWENEPDNTVGYRLRRALRFAEQASEADRFDILVADYREAYKQVRSLLPEVSDALTRKELVSPEFCLQLANLRARMSRLEEARMWHFLASVAQRSRPRPGK